MTTTNKRLSGPGLVTNAAVTYYTVPASCVTMLQHLHVSNPTVLAVGFTLSLGADAAATRIYDNFQIPAGTVLDVFVKYVMTAGQTIQALASTTNVLTMTLDGVELTPG